MRTLTYAYRSFEDARNTVVRLEAAGVPAGNISIAGRQEVGDSGTAAGLGIGGATGAATGFLLGLGALTIPGVGPVIAAGWLISGGVTGALAGGLVGALVDAGLPAKDAEYHADALRGGATLLSVRAMPEEVDRIDAILRAGLPIGPSPDGAARGGELADAVS